MKNKSMYPVPLARRVFPCLAVIGRYDQTFECVDPFRDSREWATMPRAPRWPGNPSDSTDLFVHAAVCRFETEF